MLSHLRTAVSDTHRSLRRDWKWLVCWGAGAYVLNLAIRLYELNNWAHPGLKVGGNYILATHDSYYWLVVAEGLRSPKQSILPAFTSLCVSVLGVAPEQFAFFAPAFLASLLAPMLLLWGWMLGGRCGGILPACIGSLALGFVSRSRLGYFDTDPFTLLFPLLVAWLLAWMLQGRIAEDWRCWRPRQSETHEPTPLSTLLLMGFGFGLAARFAGLWHYDIINVDKVLMWCAVGLALLLGRRGERSGLLLGLGVFGLTTFMGYYEVYHLAGLLSLSWPGMVDSGWMGILLAAVVAAGLYGLRGYLNRPAAAATAAAAVLVFMALITNQFGPLLQGASKLLVYIKPTADSAATVVGASGETVTGPLFPSVAQSIIEATNINLWDLLRRLSPLSWASLLGVPGYLLVLLLRPRSVFLLPFFLLGLGSVFLGSRFAMFAAPAVALGLGVPLAWGLRWWFGEQPRRPWLEPSILAVAGIALALPMLFQISEMPPKPVMDKPHAESLIALGERGDKNGMVWTWWDWGYATQYYTGMMTINDGGRHQGRELYPVAKAFTTPSLAQANRLMRYTATQDYDPAGTWDTMPAEDVKRFVASLEQNELETPDIAPQYLVVGWFNLNLAKWITRFGRWDLVSGMKDSGKATRIRDFRFDPGKAAVVFRNGQVINVSSVDSLEPTHVNHKLFWGRSGPHLVVNKYRGDAFLIDDTVYDSTMIQLLLSDPNEVSEYFELVYDGMPHGRIYRVVGS